ncbi:DUF1700 domain-containing protein [Sphingobium subterraneum]|uniref:Putative membrane protein n=1 Tax=Sphingobium subterraneum TaxID=627688 RepID=A0A841IZA2_9SPHN|nr:DUF1700 domain-containing protein [Sphingobium subterraneum]MBB6123983.1 putative membrane protein [Sphingobium subterraneum]
MTRDEFLKRLRRGLEGMPAASIDDIMNDYEVHFEAAREEGRSDAEVVEALGDPGRLARELRLEAGIKRWEEVRTPSSAVGAVVAFLGLGALDILVLIPILLPVIGVVIGLYVAMFGLFVAGGGILIIGPFSGFPGGPVAALLCGLGLMAAATGITALLTIGSIGLVNAILWFGRLHYRVLKPAIDPEA